MDSDTAQSYQLPYRYKESRECVVSGLVIAEVRSTFLVPFSHDTAHVYNGSASVSMLIVFWEVSELCQEKKLPDLKAHGAADRYEHFANASAQQSGLSGRIGQQIFGQCGHEWRRTSGG